MNSPSSDFQNIHDEICKLPTPDLLGFIPFRRQETDAIFRQGEFPVVARCEQGMPVPPESLRVSSDYGRTADAYLQIGKEHVTTMKAILARTGQQLPAAPQILDFGCSAGRMTRWLRSEAETGRVVGVDINATAVYWAQENLGPLFTFLTTTLSPHCPFRDATFDLVFSGSVLTHIDDLADAWLAEIARVLKPGGRAYLTIHDEATIKLLAETYRESRFGSHLAQHAGYAKYCATKHHKFTLGRGSRSHVFYRRAHLEHMVAPWYEVLSFDEGAYLYQTAMTLKAK